MNLLKWMERMKMLKGKAPISSNKRGFITLTQADGSFISARPIWENSFLTRLLIANKILLIKLGCHYYIMGYDPKKYERYIEFKAGDDQVLRLYVNGNISIFTAAQDSAGPSLLDFILINRTIIFDPAVFTINTDELPERYYVNKGKEKTKIHMLLTSGQLSKYCGIPQETLRRWKKKDILMPLKIGISGYSYYGYEQIESAREIERKRSRSYFKAKRDHKIINDAVALLTPGEVRHLSWFKNLLNIQYKSDYDNLRHILRKALAAGYLLRIDRGYYEKSSRPDKTIVEEKQ
jgi:hypothetical protein